jgi:hypothetical protein
MAVADEAMRRVHAPHGRLRGRAEEEMAAGGRRRGAAARGKEIIRSGTSSEETTC